MPMCILVLSLIHMLHSRCSSLLSTDNKCLASYSSTYFSIRKKLPDILCINFSCCLLVTILPPLGDQMLTTQLQSGSHSLTTRWTLGDNSVTSTWLLFSHHLVSRAGAYLWPVGSKCYLFQLPAWYCKNADYFDMWEFCLMHLRNQTWNLSGPSGPAVL